MSESFMPQKKAIATHLSYSPPNGEVHVFSGFAGCLRDARQATGRNLDTGEKVQGQSHGSWLGAIGYMVLLDQVGKCFRPSSVRRLDGSSIARALKYFTNLQDREVQALYALRCAFAHDYSLYNLNGQNSQLQHRFTVTSGVGGNLIELPSIPWNGDIFNKSAGTETVVNLELFGDFCESIIHNIFDLVNKNQLVVDLSQGSDELLARYSVFQRVK